VALVAAIPRFAWLDHMEFKRDEAILHLRAVQIEPGKLPRTGIDSSLGVPNPPAALYLFAIPTLLSDSPLAMAGMSALLGTATVAGVYAFGELLIARYVGLTAAILMIPAPWAVLLSRKIWAQDLLPPLSLALLAALVVFWQRPRPWLAIVIPLLVVIALQIHFSMVLLLPLAFVAFYRAMQAQLFVSSTIGILLALLICLPFLAFLRDYGIERYASQVRSLGHILTPTQSLVRAARYLGDLADYGSLEYVTTASHREFLLRPTPSPLIRWLQAPFFLAGVVAAVLGWSGSAGRWLVAWCTMALVAFAVGTREPHPHYLAACIPAIFLVMALIPWTVLPQLSLHGRPIVTGASLATLMILVAMNVTVLTGFFRQLGRTAWSGDYGPPYVERQQAIDFLLAWQSDHPHEPWALWLGPNDASPVAGDAVILAHLARLQGHNLQVTRSTSDPVNLAVCLSGPQPDVPPVQAAWHSPSQLLHVIVLPAEELRRILSQSAPTH